MIAILKIILIILFTMMIVRIYSYYYKSLLLEKNHKIKYSDCKKYIKSGDILLFRKNRCNLASYLQMYINDTPFTHVGIIYCKNNKPYVLESHPKHYCNKKTNCEGIKIYSLKNRIEKYHGDIFIKHLLCDLPNTTQERFDEFVKKYKNYPHFPSNSDIIINYINRCYLGQKTKLPLHCAELVGYILKNVLKIKNLPNEGCAYPETFNNIKHFTLPYKILF